MHKCRLPHIDRAGQLRKVSSIPNQQVGASSSPSSSSLGSKVVVNPTSNPTTIDQPSGDVDMDEGSSSDGGKSQSDNEDDGADIDSDNDVMIQYSEPGNGGIPGQQDYIPL